MKTPLNHKSLIAAIFSAALLLFSCSGKEQDNADNNAGTVDRQYVVILSMDGFRWNYTDRVPTPNFDKIALTGVKGVVQSSFPTKTFPNHYSIATGLYPDHHGIVNNTFYDPGRKTVYKISDRSKVEDGYYYGGEPIWNTAEKQGVRTASYFWVGSEADVQGMHPSIWKVYDHYFPWNRRVDSVIAWLQLPEKQRPHLILWYVPEPDGTGHKYGPESTEIDNMVMKLDTLLGYFMTSLEKLPLAAKVNVIITADHGMQEFKKENTVVLKDLLKKDWYSYAYGSNPVYNIWAEQGCKDSIINALSKVQHIKVYDKKTIPQRLHYMTNERCGDMVVVADSGYALVYKSSQIPHNAVAGTHGYDNANSNMNAIFYAYGPAFKQGFQAPLFQNIDIYNLIAHILELKPAPNDGDNGGFATLK
jgi:alkaline phosphatase D